MFYLKAVQVHKQLAPLETKTIVHQALKTF